MDAVFDARVRLARGTTSLLPVSVLPHVLSPAAVPLERARVVSWCDAP
ncbi:hypothetical protein SAMN04487848_0460 [Microbacterium sp. ru370.1]|nr:MULTISPECIES: hypothetical protein [unclassified Microbacterium]SDO33812.1 hypothetical protein SAMN04487848_0460 [Microbacterium sp. ru370.1]SIT77212.1 hypothetical protein SAMN05880579_0455 [Microbacterium sp. RU1D]